jgi:hypothetical protein
MPLVALFSTGADNKLRWREIAGELTLIYQSGQVRNYLNFWILREICGYFRLGSFGFESLPESVEASTG